MGFTHQLRINMKVFVALAALVAVADAGLLYGGYGYSGYSPYAYGAYGLGYGRYGDAEPEAEPKADTDAALLYGGYGYGYAAPYAYGSYASPYYYGARTYGYGLGYGHYYGKRS